MYPTMDEKIMLEKRYGRRTPLPTYSSPSRSPSQVSRARTRRSIITYVALIAGMFFTMIYIIPSYLHGTSRDIYPEGLQRVPSSQTPLPHSTAAIQTKVPLEAHIMSKCPDARDCLRDLVVPAMEQVVDKVDFKLSYIGKIDQYDNLQCMHGPTECLGNIMGLCAQQLYPDDVKISLGFSTCMIMKYQQIPDREMVSACAMEHGVDFEKLNACISEEGHGMDLLEASVERSQKANVTKSCTVRIGDEKWCVRDGGEWKECEGGHEVEDLVKEVEKRYNKD